jgi:hypothetical protein
MPEHNKQANVNAINATSKPSTPKVAELMKGYMKLTTGQKISGRYGY